MPKKIKNEVIVYQTKTGAIELKSDFKKDTIWATQIQIASIFNIDRTVVTKHIGNILESKEVDQKSNVQKMHIANSDKPVMFYSLDIILAVGYRANSARAIQFRQWATKTLRQHITKGFTSLVLLGILCKHLAVSNYIRQLKKKPLTFYILLSKIIRLWMETKEAARTLLFGFYRRRVF